MPGPRAPRSLFGELLDWMLAPLLVIWPVGVLLTWGVAQDLARQLMHPHLGFVLFFCSAEYDLPALGDALRQYFGGVRLVGCTSAGEITSQGYGRSCVTAVGFDHRSFSIACELIDEMDRFSLIEAQQLVERLGSDCRSNSLAPIKDHSFALTLLDGLSSREEMVLAALSAALGDIPHFGGSAGDDNYLNRTHVYHGGAFHSGGSLTSSAFHSSCGITRSAFDGSDDPRTC